MCDFEAINKFVSFLLTNLCALISHDTMKLCNSINKLPFSFACTSFINHSRQKYLNKLAHNFKYLISRQSLICKKSRFVILCWRTEFKNIVDTAHTHTHMQFQILRGLPLDNIPISGWKLSKSRLHFRRLFVRLFPIFSPYKSHIIFFLHFPPKIAGFQFFREFFSFSGRAARKASKQREFRLLEKGYRVWAGKGHIPSSKNHGKFWGMGKENILKWRRSILRNHSYKGRAERSCEGWKS